MIPTWLLFVIVALPFVGGLTFAVVWATLRARKGDTDPAKLLGVLVLVVLWAIAWVALAQRVGLGA